MASIPVENRKRSIDNSLGIFTQALMWFMDGAVTQEKLGVVKLMLCNLNCDCDCDDKIKEKINPMIDTLVDLIGEIQENKKVVDFNSKQPFWSFWVHLENKESKESKESKEKVGTEHVCQEVCKVCQQVIPVVPTLKQKSVNVAASFMNFVTFLAGNLRAFATNVKKF